MEILNCDVGACPLEPHTKRLMEICNLYQCHQTIVEPTRVTKNTATTIDLFITNNPNMYAHSRVCQLGINDHSLIYAIRKFYIPKSSATIIMSRQFRSFHEDAFSYDLNLAPWHIIQYESNQKLCLANLEKYFPNDLRFSCASS